MKSTFLSRILCPLAFALLLGVPAFATHPTPTPDPTPTTTSTSNASADADAAALAVAAQQQGQLQGQGQGQGQSQTGINQQGQTLDNTNSVKGVNQQGQTSENTNSNDNSNRNSNGQGQSQTNAGNAVTSTTTVSSIYKQVRQTASAHADAGNATIRCAKDRRAGIQLPGIGFSAGGTATDRDCLLLDAAQDELDRGNLKASIDLRCATKLYRVLGEDCAALLDTQTKPAADTASKEYVDRAVKKALAK